MTGRLVLFQKRPGCVLGLLNVGLVEGVDLENGPGDRGRDLPPQKLATQGRRFRHLDLGDRSAGRLQTTDDRVLRLLGGGVAEPDRREHAIGAVVVGCGHLFSGDRYDTDAVLAGALGD